MDLTQGYYYNGLKDRFPEAKSMGKDNFKFNYGDKIWQKGFSITPFSEIWKKVKILIYELKLLQFYKRYSVATKGFSFIFTLFKATKNI